MSLSAHLARLNQQLALRSAFSQHIGNPQARAAIAAQLAELSHVRVDAADYDSEFGAQRTDAFCDELTDHTDSRDSDYQAGLADFERREAQAPTPKAHMSKPNQYRTDPALRAASLQYLRPFDGDPKDGMSAPEVKERFDAALEAEARRAADDIDERTTRSTMNVRAVMAGRMALDEHGDPCLPSTPAEQRSFESGAQRVREQQAREGFRAQQVRLDGKHDQCTSCGATLDPDDAGVQTLCPKCRTTDKGSSRQRMQRRAADAWRTGPLTPAEQRQVDLARAGREPDDAA